jgi:hypothetical protein
VKFILTAGAQLTKDWPSMQQSTIMPTPLDLPDDIPRRDKIAAVERSSNSPQLVIDALPRESEKTAPAIRRRMDTWLATLDQSADCEMVTFATLKLRLLVPAA